MCHQKAQLCPQQRGTAREKTKKKVIQFNSHATDSYFFCLGIALPKHGALGNLKLIFPKYGQDIHLYSLHQQG